jgi:hypothetical protein
MYLKGEYSSNMMNVLEWLTKWDSPGRLSRNQKHIEEKDDRKDEPVEGKQ